MKITRIKILPFAIVLASIYLGIGIDKDILPLKHIIAMSMLIIGSMLNFLVCYFNDNKMIVPVPNLLKSYTKNFKSERHTLYFNKNDKKIKFKFLGDNFIIIPTFFNKISAISIGDMFIFLGIFLTVLNIFY